MSQNMLHGFEPWLICKLLNEDVLPRKRDSKTVIAEPNQDSISHITYVSS